MITDTVQQIPETESTKTSENDETVEDEEPFFQDIYSLADLGVHINDIEELRKSGINTIKGLQMTTRVQLLLLPTFNLEKVNKILELCQRVSTTNCFITALEVSEERKQVFKIGTGSTNLDKLLGGGIESMAVTQVFGEAGTGKTQLAHTLCVTAQLPSLGYPGGKVMFIDTEHTFRPERIRHVARRFKLEEDKVLDNIFYARAYNSEHQYELLKKVGAKFHEEVGMFKLLIVDSIMALFRVDFLGHGQLCRRQQKIAEMMSLLQKMSEEFNIAVFITNQITSEMKFSLLDTIATDSDGKPIGGNILAHASTTRVALKKISGNVRLAKLYDSPELEESEEAFIITTGGIKDPKIEDK